MRLKKEANAKAKKKEEEEIKNIFYSKAIRRKFTVSK